MASKDFAGKKVLIAGGTAGPGFAAAKLLAGRGATLSVTRRSIDV